MNQSERYAALLRRFDELQMFGIKLGLEQTAELFRRSGAPFAGRYLHLAGTNGKGSTGAMLEAALRGVGFQTGFYSSPHLVDVRERFRINGRAAGEAAMLRAAEPVAEAADAMRRSGAEPTYFEFTTALAALLFAQEKCDFVIWETGMGGRFDATSVVEPEAAIITNLALDHQQYLGNTLEKIAFEKAGIIRPGRPVFTGLLPDVAERVVTEQAEVLGAPLFPADDAPIDGLAFGRDGGGLYQEFSHRGRRVRLHLPGAMQRRNYRVVYRVLAELAGRYGFRLDAALDALAATRWPGRCQVLDDRLLLDGGHNPDGAAALAECLRETFPGERFTILFAGFRDKAVSENLRCLAPLAAEFIFTPLAESRPSCDGAELTRMLRSFSELPATAAANVDEALALAESRPRRILAAGSLYLVGAILARRNPDAALNLDGTITGETK